MSSDKCISKKIIYSNNVDTDMVDYNALANMLARVPDREIPNLLRMRDERREIRSNVVEPKKSVRELVQYFEENMSKPPPIPPPRLQRVAQLTQIKSALKKHHQSFNISLVFYQRANTADAKNNTWYWSDAWVVIEREEMYQI